MVGFIFLLIVSILWFSLGGVALSAGITSGFSLLIVLAFLLFSSGAIFLTFSTNELEEALMKIEFDKKRKEEDNERKD